MNIQKCMKCFGVLLLTAVFTACNKSESVNVYTLSKIGEDFYFGEKVVMWAGTETKNIEDIRYSWECDGGAFEGPQNLFENLWVAPKTPGKYTVRVTAKVGKNTSTRETTMNVVRFFYDTFDSSNSTANWSNSNSGLTILPATNQLQVKVNNTNSTGNIRRSLTAVPIGIPSNFMANIGFSDYSTAATSVTLQFRILFATPNDKETPFIREIRWQMTPRATGTTNNFQIQYETYLPTTNKSQWINIVAAKRDPVGTFAVREYKDLCVQISEDKVLHVYANGTELNIGTGSTAIKEWLTAHPNEKPVCKEFNITYPALVTMLVGGVYIQDGSNPNDPLINTLPQ